MRTVTVMDPAAAVTVCETALRTLMELAYAKAHGDDWLQHIAAAERRADWSKREQEEQKRRGNRGVAVVPQAGLSYSHLFDLIEIADAHWQPLSAALGKKADTLPLLKRLDTVRNAVAHGRPLVPFERDLISGIAGQIRNQVTIYMSTADPAGDIYPRIEWFADGLGTEAAPCQPDDNYLWVLDGRAYSLQAGDVLTFDCTATDPQGRDIVWTIEQNSGEAAVSVTVASQEMAHLTWTCNKNSVSEHFSLTVSMSATGTTYHRGGFRDSWVDCRYVVRPPTPRN